MSVLRRELIQAAGMGLVLAAMATASAAADSVSFTADMQGSTNQLADFDGVLTYTYDQQTEIGHLIIEITNTTTASYGGAMTAMLFNIPADEKTRQGEYTGSSTHGMFLAISDEAERNGSPFGTPYDVGAGLVGRFQGGGSPTNGVKIGQTGVFNFEITAADAATLSAADFLTQDRPTYSYGLLFRFRGMAFGAGSDKVGAVLIPLPPAVGLGLAALPVAFFARRRYTKSRSA